MTRIKRVYIAPFWYDVEYSSSLAAAAGVLGACNTDSQTILMDTGAGPDVMVETLFHESLHAAWTQTALDKLLTDEQEEQVIYTMSPRIVGIIRDNPPLARAITDKRK